jgi:hypothetical protein
MCVFVGMYFDEGIVLYRYVCVCVYAGMGDDEEERKLKRNRVLAPSNGKI